MRSRSVVAPFAAAAGAHSASSGAVCAVVSARSIGSGAWGRQALGQSWWQQPAAGLQPIRALPPSQPTVPQTPGWRPFFHPPTRVHAQTAAWLARPKHRRVQRARLFMRQVQAQQVPPVLKALRLLGGGGWPLVLQGPWCSSGGSRLCFSWLASSQKLSPGDPQTRFACAADSSCEAAAGSRAAGQVRSWHNMRVSKAGTSATLYSTVRGTSASLRRLQEGRALLRQGKPPTWMSPGSRSHSRCSCGSLARSVTACSACGA